MLLVTCVAENVSKAVLAELAGKPVAVRAVSRDPTKLAVTAGNIEIVQGDLSDAASLERVLEGIEVAFLASEFCPKMAQLHTRFLAAAKNAGVKRIVLLSGIGANEEICCARALRWLGQVEKDANESGMSVTYLRPAFLMQNLLQFAPDVVRQGVIAGPFRGGQWTWVDARDVGAVAAVALLDAAHAGKTYIVTGSQTLSYGEIAERLGRVLGKPVRYTDITANETRGKLQAEGMAPVMIEAVLELWDACASNFVNVAPTNVVLELTGRAPRTFEEFVHDYRGRFQWPAAKSAEIIV